VGNNRHFPSVYLNAGSAATASFGIEIKAAGYDALVITGRADKPVYLLIDDDKATLKDAGHLWGKDAYEAEDAIHAADGDNFEVASVGQAGELGVRLETFRPGRSPTAAGAEWGRSWDPNC